MIIDSLWTASGPCKRDVRILERLEDRRTLIEAFQPPESEDGAAGLRRHLLETLNAMEDALCLYGPNARALTLGWQTLDLLEPRLFESARCESPPDDEPPGDEPPRDESPRDEPIPLRTSIEPSRPLRRAA
ncbi:MAG: hypothetical protein AAF560_17935 [Acidobacteriota bacterium]